MFSFEDLLTLDRPYVPFSIKMRGKNVSLLARRLTAADQDALEAYFADEYAKLVVRLTEAPAGKKSELEQIKEIYSNLTRPELIDKKIGSRSPWIHEEALKLAGLSSAQILAERQELSSSEDSEAMLAEYDKNMEEALRIAVEQVTESYRAEYDTWSSEELVEDLAKLTINIKANNEARQSQNARRLFYIVYVESPGKDSPTRFFPSEEAITQLSREAIEKLLLEVEKAFEVEASLPFELPADHEQDGPAQSQSISEEVTKDSGKPTKTRRKGS